ncbi:hypothetical protein UY3_19213 [Chelonia mydas]|uniref:Uncharacterized protein n=1 Tax=Chelonia mydas TaxID=8469 RepID=M7AFY0_CHEMY|nr:hypothetical protein UY3_19213 [Chelonia mydas]
MFKSSAIASESFDAAKICVSSLTHLFISLASKLFSTLLSQALPGRDRSECLYQGCAKW